MTSLPLSAQELLSEIESLKQEVAELQQERDDLEMMLEMTTEHSEFVEEELHTRAEEALRKSARQLRAIVEAIPVPLIISHQSDSKIVFVNEMAGPLVGLTRDDLLGRSLADFYDDPALIQKLRDDGEVDNYELQIRRADGTLLWTEVALRQFALNDEPSVLIVIYDITQRKRNFEASLRFVPNEFLEFFQKERIADIELGEHISGEMSVMFSDVRSFTTLSEGMTPRENFDFVNEYLGRVSPVVREHNGFVVKYLGDGIMAVFPHNADSAVQASIETLRRVAQLNIERAERGQFAIHVGLGIHFGQMMVGMVGEASRIQGDAFSDDVNLASRIEGLTKFYDVSLIISEETFNELEDPDRYHTRFLDMVQVSGRKEAVHLYEVFSADPPEIRLAKSETQEILSEAQSLYYSQDFRGAQVELFKVLQRNPSDKVAWHFLVQATKWLDDGVPDNWTGVTVMTKK